MRLPKPFYRLPLRFDVERLRAEVAALPQHAWAKHPNEIRGNTSLRLISVEGGENDDVNGAMRMTPHLIASPYMRQILAGFGVVWSRSRLLRLAPGANVPEHADINHHWFTRVRLHIPIITRPEVRFYCGDQSVHMAAGEAWIFDNWRPHRVENPTEHERIHLVADTSGSAAFWRLAMQSDPGSDAVQRVAFSSAREWTPLTECAPPAPVMPPAEVDVLVQDLCAELIAHEPSPQSESRRLRYLAMLDALRRDWRQLYALHGDANAGWSEFAKLRDSVRETSRAASSGLVMRTNGVGVHAVLEGRLLRAMLPAQSAATSPRPRGNAPARPVFIVAAPRSGSTLLFETLAASPQICTLGGEAHWLVEGIDPLRPDVPGGVESNRLTAMHATPEVADQIVEAIASRLRDHAGAPLEAAEGRVFLEKTPKNSLRIPFFDAIFPDARFVFLWRDPRENIGSIIDAWRDGRWRTYPSLPGFDGAWSLLLPPGYRSMSGKALEEIAAWQWCEANRIILDDLSRLASERWTTIRYADLVRDPRSVIESVCTFLGLHFDAALDARLSAALPLSRYTLTAPDPDKWRRHESAIQRVLPLASPIEARLRALH